MDQGDIAGKLAAWCVLYGAAMVFIGLRIYGRLHIFGNLRIDHWLMTVAGLFYTASMIIEILLWIALRGIQVYSYIQVSSDDGLSE